MRKIKFRYLSAIMNQPTDLRQSYIEVYVRAYGYPKFKQIVRGLWVGKVFLEKEKKNRKILKNVFVLLQAFAKFFQ